MAIVDRLLKRLEGKTAWLIGGKRIGQVVAQALAEQGANLIVNYHRSKDEAERTAAAARALGRKAIALQCDVSDRRDVERAVAEIRRQFPEVHILVNMPSVFDRVAFDGIRPDVWERNIDSHILGSFWPIQLAAPLMPPGSHIVNVSDRTSVGPVYPDYLPYVVTKGAVTALTRAAAKELAARGIIVNEIAPGPILPGPGIDQKEWRGIRDASPLKIPVTDQETVEQFALLVVYLCTVTLASGATYPLDQGQNL